MFVNPRSGPDDSPGVEDIEAALGPLGYVVEPVEDARRLPDMVSSALERACRSVGIAGGDGTVRCAAQVLAGTGMPMLVVPAGTRNHFAKEIGIEDLQAAEQAARAGSERKVSVGRVAGQVFVNNASIGLYPALVRHRERHEVGRSKAVAGLIAAFHLARHGQPLLVEVDGVEMSAWLVFIGNGRYGEGFGDLIERDSVDAGVLDVRVIQADRPLARIRVIASVAVGRMTKSSLVMARETKQVSIGVEGRCIDVALDGEVVSLDAPLVFTVEPSSLAVLAPPEERPDERPDEQPDEQGA